MSLVTDGFDILFDSATGVNVSPDGSAFSVVLEEGGLSIPPDALNVTVAVKQANIVWVMPNVLTGVNDKLYVTGDSLQTVITSQTDLGYSATQTYTIVSGSISLSSGSNLLIVGAFSVGDYFRVMSGPLQGQEFEILTIVTDTTSSQDYTISNTTAFQVPSTSYTFARSQHSQPVLTNFEVTIPQGLYDLPTLASEIIRQLTNLSAQPGMFNLLEQTATQRVEILFNYDNVSIDFTQPNTVRNLLGFDSQILGPYDVVPYSVLGDTVAAFNQIQSFLLHSDLVSQGIRINNNYQQVIAQVLIDVPPGSNQTYIPPYPTPIRSPELAGSRRNLIRVWLTDQSNNAVNTNSEAYTVQVRIEWLIPYLYK